MKYLGHVRVREMPPAAQTDVDDYPLGLNWPHFHAEQQLGGQAD
jgi:hypothetical protein